LYLDTHYDNPSQKEKIKTTLHTTIPLATHSLSPNYLCGLDYSNFQIIPYVNTHMYPKHTNHRKSKTQFIHMTQNIHLHNVMLIEDERYQGQPSVMFETILVYDALHDSDA